MNTALVTLACPPMDPTTRAKACIDSQRAAAERWDAEYLEITMPLSDAHPWFQKLTLCNLDYDRVIFVDEDLIIRDDCPNPADIVPEDLVGGVPSGESYLRDCPSARHGIKLFAGAAGIDPHETDLENDMAYFNAGLLVFTPSIHAQIFTRALEIATHGGLDPVYCPEQACLMLAIREAERREGRTWHYPLPNRFNHCHYHPGEPGKYPASAFGCHVGRGRVNDLPQQTVWRTGSLEAG